MVEKRNRGSALGVLLTNLAELFGNLKVEGNANDNVLEMRELHNHEQWKRD